MNKRGFKRLSGSTLKWWIRGFVFWCHEQINSLWLVGCLKINNEKNCLDHFWVQASQSAKKETNNLEVNGSYVQIHFPLLAKKYDVIRYKYYLLFTLKSRTVTNSSDNFTNFITTNLRIFYTKMNVVIYIDST